MTIWLKKLGRQQLWPVLGAGVILLSALGLSGCSETKAIEDRDPVIAIGVDPTPQPGTLLWTFVMPNPTVTPSNIASLSSSQQFVTTTVPAPDWISAIARAQEVLSRDLYLGQLQMVALNRHIGWRSATEAITALNNDGLIPKSFWMVTTKGKAATILSATSPTEVIPRYFLAAYFTCTSCHAVNWGVFGWQWWVRRMSPGVSPIAPVVTGATHQLRVSTLAVYRPGQSALIMPPTVAMGLAYLTGRIVKGSLSGRIDGQMVAVSRLRAKPAVRVRLSGAGVSAHVVVTVSGFLTEMPAGASSQVWITRANHWAAQRLLAMMWDAIRWSNRTHTDPFGYTRDALWSDPGVAARLSPGQFVWRPLHPDLTVTVHVRSSGTAL